MRAWTAFVATFVAKATPRARLALAAMIALALAGRVAIIFAAVSMGRSDARAATLGAVVAGVLYAIERGVGAFARASVECDLHRMTVRALLGGDVLEVPAVDVSRLVIDGTFRALQLLTGSLPSLVADGLVAIGAIPLLVTTLPPRLVGLASGALLIVVAGVFVMRRATKSLEERTLSAYLALSDTVAAAVEGRLEIVASGGERELMTRLEKQLGIYERHSLRAAYGAALVGRAPIAAAAVVVGSVLVAEGAQQEILAGTVLAQALVLAATVRPMLGAVIAVQDVARSARLVEPFTALLDRPPRWDATRTHGASAALPAPVEAHGLSFSYDQTAPVLSDLNFAWSRAEPVILLGPNGSGKSTLLRLLLGLRPPTSGGLRIAGRDVATLNLAELRRKTAYLPQRPYLGEAHTTLRAAMTLRHAESTDDAILEALDRTGIATMFSGREDLLAVPVGELSAGQRQRVALARVLLHTGAKLVLLDEPDANLDREGIAIVASLIRELAAAGKMVVVVAHTSELTAISARHQELVSENARERRRAAG